MPFIPHTEADVAHMLAGIGAPSIDTLFDEIPAALIAKEQTAIPPALNEMEIARLMEERAEADGRWLNFIGAGAYEHHIPAAVWQIVSRGEFYTAYTPYQAEASQGTLQLLYEWQTMMASLTGMDVSNASLYDGGSALAEAVLMAVRAGKKGCRRVLMPVTVHPFYRKAVMTAASQQGIEIVEIPYCTEAGNTVPASLAARVGDGIAALVIPQPNFFGVLEDVDALADFAHAHDALAIGVCNPVSLALLKPPGEWGGDSGDASKVGRDSGDASRVGVRGADIAVGEAQPLGIPLSGGGPYLGYMACKQALVRQMPGRIIGRTVDLDGRTGYTLTLQAREQHIRRSKATSNICTNQGLMVTAATIYMALTGPQGLERIAAASHANARKLKEMLCALPGVAAAFEAPFFHEVVVRLPLPVASVLEKLREQRILGGLDLCAHFPELGNALLVCATETKTEDDLRHLAAALGNALKA